VSAAAHDPGAASGVLAPSSCGVPSGTPRRSSLRFVSREPQAVPELLKLTRGRRIVPVVVREGRIEIAPGGGSVF